MELLDEIELLKEIYFKELKSITSLQNGGTLVTVDIRPATAEELSKQFICVTLLAECPVGYPDTEPLVELKCPRGLEEDKLTSLLNRVREKAGQLRGEFMLMHLIELVKESLTQQHLPDCQCSICLEDFSTDADLLVTECFHYFHSACLAGFVQYRESEHARLVHEALANDPHCRNLPELCVACPVCRQCRVAFDPEGRFISELLPAPATDSVGAERNAAVPALSSVLLKDSQPPSDISRQKQVQIRASNGLYSMEQATSVDPNRLQCEKPNSFDKDSKEQPGQESQQSHGRAEECKSQAKEQIEFQHKQQNRRRYNQESYQHQKHHCNQHYYQTWQRNCPPNIQDNYQRNGQHTYQAGQDYEPNGQRNRYQTSHPTEEQNGQRNYQRGQKSLDNYQLDNPSNCPQNIYNQKRNPRCSNSGPRLRSSRQENDKSNQEHRVNPVGHLQEADSKDSATQEKQYQGTQQFDNYRGAQRSFVRSDLRRKNSQDVDNGQSDRASSQKTSDNAQTDRASSQQTSDNGQTDRASSQKTSDNAQTDRASSHSTSQNQRSANQHHRYQDRRPTFQKRFSSNQQDSQEIKDDTSSYKKKPQHQQPQQSRPPGLDNSQIDQYGGRYSADGRFYQANFTWAAGSGRRGNNRSDRPGPPPGLGGPHDAN